MCRYPLTDSVAVLMLLLLSVILRTIVMNVCCVSSGFYAELPDDNDDDDDRSACDGPCALRAGSDVGESSVCDVERDDHAPPRLLSTVDDQPGTGTATPEHWPVTMSSGSGRTASTIVPGRCRPLVLMLVASLPRRRRAAATFLSLLLITVVCLERVRLIRRLPAGFVYR